MCVLLADIQDVEEFLEHVTGAEPSAAQHELQLLIRPVGAISWQPPSALREGSHRSGQTPCPFNRYPKGCRRTCYSVKGVCPLNL